MIRKKLLTFLCLLISISIFAQKDTRLVVKSTKAGQLKGLIAQKGYDISEVDRLKIKGQINMQDIRTVVVEMEQLKELDLENTTVVGGKFKYHPNDKRELTGYADELTFGLYMLSGLFGGDTIIPKKLEKIVLPKNLKKLAHGVFSAHKERYALLKGEVRLPLSLTFIGSEVFAHTGISYAVPLPNSLEYICSGTILAKGTLRLPLKLMYLNAAQFSCPNTTSFFISAKNDHFTVIDGVLFNKDKTILLFYPRGRKGSYVVPSFVKKIGDYAFWACEELTEIELNKELEEIGKSVFALCEKLTKVKVNNNQNIIEPLKRELGEVYRKGGDFTVADIRIE